MRERNWQQDAELNALRSEAMAILFHTDKPKTVQLMKLAAQLPHVIERLLEVQRLMYQFMDDAGNYRRLSEELAAKHGVETEAPQ